MFAWQLENTHMLLTSRKERNIQSSLETQWRKDPTVRQDIETTLVNRAQEMFRWAVCQLDTLGKCRTQAALQKALVTLPPILDKIYNPQPLSVDEIAEIIAINLNDKATFNRDGIPEDPPDVLNIYSNIVTITTEESETQDPVKQVVALSHYLVKEYLISDRIQKGSAAHYSIQHAVCHNAIARSRLGYLLQFQGVKMLSHDNAKEFRLADHSARF
ncbi:hypothetical protein GGP41_002100 [Bipolaris sorokiniana]|uniref:Uncharacterized protein n=1 Tax=Cochliobolus sativus TaxID=45130 RepID=A0A8H5ZQI6_COCSA|nr:hypothetical protein GGP41_002100 [Bipolaris sorokiniana]